MFTAAALPDSVSVALSSPLTVTPLRLATRSVPCDTVSVALTVSSLSSASGPTFTPATAAPVAFSLSASVAGALAVGGPATGATVTTSVAVTVALVLPSESCSVAAIVSVKLPSNSAGGVIFKLDRFQLATSYEALSAAAVKL